MTPKLEFNLTMPCSTVFSRKQLTKAPIQVTVCPPAPRWSSRSLRARPPVRLQAQVSASALGRASKPSQSGVIVKDLENLSMG